MTEAPEGSITWQLSALDRVGGLPVRVEGSPRIIESPFGKAAKFDGKGDALFIDTHPILFELRVVGDEWFLHSFVHGPGYSRALVFPEKLHPVGPACASTASATSA